MTIAFSVFWMSLYICKNSGSRSALPNVLVSIRLKATCTGTHSASVMKSQSRWIEWRIAVEGNWISYWARLNKRESHTFNGLGFPRVHAHLSHRRRIPLAPVVHLASRIPLVPLAPLIPLISPTCISRPLFPVLPVGILVSCP